MTLPNLLYLGQTPFQDKLDSAPKVRTYFLYQAFKKIANVTFINGSRKSRINPLIEHLKHFPKDYYDAAYLEAATSTSTPIDFMMLYHLKQQKIPLGIFIRDLYPIFNLTPRTNLKEELLYRSWFVSQYVYQKTASVLFYPTQPFTEFFDFPRQVLLPPGARKNWLPQTTDTHAPKDIVLYSGNLSPENGRDIIFQVMDKLTKTHPDKKLLIISNSDCPAPWSQAPWLIHIKGSLEDAIPFLPRILCGVIPRPLSDYNHIAMPIKAMDYLSLGLPILVTKCRELQHFVESEQLGLACDYDEDALYTCLLRLLTQKEEYIQFKTAVRQAVLKKHNWSARANFILSELTTPR